MDLNEIEKLFTEAKKINSTPPHKRTEKTRKNLTIVTDRILELTNLEEKDKREYNQQIKPRHCSIM